MKPKLGAHYQRFMRQTPDYEKENQEEQQKSSEASDQTSEEKGKTERYT